MVSTGGLRFFLSEVIYLISLYIVKFPGSDQIPVELIQAGGKTLLSAVHKLFNSICNREELSDQWKESIIVPVHKNGHKTSNYCGRPLVSTLYNILSNILLSKLRTYLEEVIGDHQYGF
jgi:hypothetical protein